jgi:hypothetical protein
VTQPEPVPLKAMQRQLGALVDDLRTQSEAVPELKELLAAQYAGGTMGERTGATFEEWREEQLDQAAVAWLLGTVFVRFCEDNELVSGLWLAGPGDRTEAAAQAQTAYFMASPRHNDRDWILQAFGHLRELGATKGIFDIGNPVWNFPISADAAGELLHFWRRGAGIHSFVDSTLDTRFLGDLYQDLSEYARKRYALLQTPEFVEEFILDLTLTPSIAEYGLAETSLIDPTCGSGHFLLGAFARLNKLWMEREPGTDPRVRVQKALSQITGVDINPFAVSIARFRLVIAAMQASGEPSLEPGTGFNLRLAAGDSLLRWGVDTSHQGELEGVVKGREEFAYFTEDGQLLAKYLERGQYTVAVGNPPYITVKDKTLNRRYRELYKTCAGTYALSVPFVERLFQLVRRADESGRAGFVGQITANSFMKREFGKKLIERFFAGMVDPSDREQSYAELSHVIDTSGAYIPGHGTPTVILVGRRRYPKSKSVRAVLGILGEPSAPNDPARGLVWTAIVHHVNDVGASSPYITVADVPRAALARHPWSLAGGGAAGVVAAIEAAGRSRMISDIEPPVGRGIRAGADEAFMRPLRGSLSLRAPKDRLKPLLIGEAVRDWGEAPQDGVLYPYHDDTAEPGIEGELWPWRQMLAERRTFQGNMRDAGLHWWEYMQHTASAYRTPLSIAFAFVATHNHFVLDRGGKVFNRTAPVIKLPENAAEADHLALLGLLNSSTACFWLKQISHSRGSTVDSHGARQSTVPWEDFYEFTGTKLQEFPVPARSPVTRARQLDGLASKLSAKRPAAVCRLGLPTKAAIGAARESYDLTRAEMIAAQEELDWEVYRLYGLLDKDLTAPPDAVPELNLGERAFEIVLARKMAAGTAETQWFVRHGSTPITEVPAHWPAAYRSIVERRIQVIEERSDIALIERPECKRRWASTPWEVQEKDALRDWLLDRLEAKALWREPGRARPLSVAQLAGRIGPDAEFRDVLALYCGRDDYDLTAELVSLADDEAVPYLATDRYKESGLRKRAQWERTWDLQRREDKGEQFGPIPVPPKYVGADFTRQSYWRNRGKLDVPKERFILYPKAGRDADKTPVIGWAGWNHLDQAQALATLYIDRKTDEGWPADRLLPLLAGLVELEPWLHQWYADPVTGYPGSPAAFYTALINTELSALGFGRGDLTPERLA